MTLSQLTKTAVTGLATNRSRSFLTILGIVIGITAIIIVMSLGQGAQGLILGEIQSIGSRVIAIVPGRQPTSPTDFLSTFTNSLKESDLTALENKGNVPHALTVMPVDFGSEAISWQTNTYQATLFGTTELFGEIYNLTTDEGNIFGADDVASLANVAVIGKTVEQKLFGTSSGIGQKIRINNTTFRVVGVLKSTGQLSFLNFDEAVIIPYTTAQTYIFGISYFNRMVVEADSNSTVNETADDIVRTLRNDHGIIDPSKDDFFIQTQESAMQTVSTILNVLTLFLASVAAVSLVVGGIGIMNIMLVSVTERTREIGLRKALGATDENILSQFLLEAVMLTAIGGVIGIVLGGLVSFGVALILSKVYAVELAIRPALDSRGPRPWRLLRHRTCFRHLSRPPSIKEKSDRGATLRVAKAKKNPLRANSSSHVSEKGVFLCLSFLALGHLCENFGVLSEALPFGLHVARHFHGLLRVHVVQGSIVFRCPVNDALIFRFAHAPRFFHIFRHRFSGFLGPKLCPSPLALA